MAIFGAAIERHGSTYALPVGQGIASLGCLLVEQCLVEVNEWNGKRSIKARITLDGRASVVAVTDLRLYDPTNYVVDAAKVGTLQRLFATPGDVILSLGVSRPFRATYDAVERHWLQVNGIFPRTDPFWGYVHQQAVIRSLPVWLAGLSPLNR